MTISKILDNVCPFTKEEMKCNVKKQQKEHKRKRLTQMILLHNQGKEVRFTPVLNDEQEQLLKQLLNITQ